MHEWISDLVLLWLAIAISALAVAAALVDEVVDRALAVSLLSLVVAAALIVLAIDRSEAGYLDGALVLALLGFGQTVALARFVAARRELP